MPSLTTFENCTAIYQAPTVLGMAALAHLHAGCSSNWGRQEKSGGQEARPAEVAAVRADSRVCSVF